MENGFRFVITTSVYVAKDGLKLLDSREPLVSTSFVTEDPGMFLGVQLSNKHFLTLKMH
jgi:hypothetical protein